MRRQSPLVRQNSDADINNAMTPMIDVVFLLLVFFVWTASFQAIEFVMPPSEMSSQVGTDQSNQEEPPPPKDFPDIVVRIRWQQSAQQPAWMVNQQAVDSIETVQAKLMALAKLFDQGGDDQVLVILHPDPEVPLGFVIDTYDAALTSGFPKLSFAVNR